MSSVGGDAVCFLVRGNFGGGYVVAHCYQWEICGVAV